MNFDNFSTEDVERLLDNGPVSKLDFAMALMITDELLEESVTIMDKIVNNCTRNGVPVFESGADAIESILFVQKFADHRKRIQELATDVLSG